MEQTQYKINLEIFEGPLDLLLYLIRKNDLSISDIPITLILDQYNEYLELMDELDIDIAGEFILMASELAHIKSRLLLNRDFDTDAEEEDPRADLVARLMEYQRYKNAGQWLISRRLLNRDVFKRPKTSLQENEAEEELMEVEPFFLLKAFHEILKKVPQNRAHEVEVDRISVTDRIYQILEHFKEVESLSFEALFPSGITRGDLVISFLAILEMARLKMIKIYQIEPRGAIRMRKCMEISDEKADVDIKEEETYQ